MKILSSTLIALSVFASSAAYAQPRAAEELVPDTRHESIFQPTNQAGHRVPLYYVKSEDISNSLYWLTPKELGGGAESSDSWRAPAR